MDIDDLPGQALYSLRSEGSPWLVSGGQSHVEHATSIPRLKLVQREGISPSNTGGSEGAPKDYDLQTRHSRGTDVGAKE